MQEELHRFLMTLYGPEDRGWFVYVPHITRSRRFYQNWFRWPLEIATITNYILTTSRESDVYIAPALFREKKADKTGVASARAVWLDYDKETPVDLSGLPEPTIRVQTSTPTHEHIYWSTSEISVPVLEDINRRLAHYTDADYSGSDCTQILRPPGTLNHKYDSPIPVVLKQQLGAAVEARYLPESFDHVPAVPHEIVLEDLGIIPAWADVVSTYKNYLPKKTLQKILTGPDTTVEDRSQWLFIIGCELAEIGLKTEEIMSLVMLADEKVGKYANRTDQHKRVQALAIRAQHTVKAKASIPIYGFDEILALDINLNCIWGDYLPSNGNLMLAGAPGAGKTHFTLQAAMHFATNKALLSRQVNFTDERPISFLSMEMPPAGLKWLCNNLVLGLEKTDREAVNRSLRIVGEGVPYPCEQLEKTIDEINPSLVMFDSMSSMAEGRMSDEEEVQRITRWDALLRSTHDCTTWYIHHNRKATGDNKKPDKLSDIYGSYLFGAKFDAVFTLWRDHSGQKKIALKAVKTRYGEEFELELHKHSDLTYKLDKEVKSDNPDSGTAPGVKELDFE